MTKVVHKFMLQPDTIGISMIRPLKVAWQKGELYLWAEVDQDGKENKWYDVSPFPTGIVSISSEWTYVDSGISDNLCFHVYVREANVLRS